MYEEDFPIRLAKLRALKGVSAREMSLAIGQNPSYINNIESGKALPSMSGFFFICEYLGITPQEFFDTESSAPEEIRILTDKLKRLDPEQIKTITALVDGLIR